MANKWTAGSAVVATDYSVGRDTDATNQMHLNVPTGASFEWSINDVAKLTLDGTGGVFAGTLSASNLSGTNTGDQTSVSGNAGTATALQTARTIGGVSFNGTADITVASATGGFAVSGGALTMNTQSITGLGSDVTGTAGTVLTLKTPDSTGTAAGTNIVLRAGAASTNGAGGHVILWPGLQAGSNAVGAVQVYSPSSGTAVGQFSSTGAGIFSIQPTGGITNIQIGTTSAGTARLSLDVPVSSTFVNYLQATGAAASSEPAIAALGTDTDIDITLTPKGAGDVVVSAGGLRISGGRIQGLQGADVVSASNLVLTEGNVFEVTGTTAIDRIDSTGWQEGSRVTLVFNESVTVNHATASSGANITILLSGGANFSATANDTLTLVLCSTTANGQAWREVSRTAI